FAWALNGRGLSGFPLLRGGASGAPTPTATATATPTPFPPCNPDPAQQQHYPTIALAANPPDHSIAVGRSASDKGITITLQRVYADATQTVVTFTTSPDGGALAFNAALYDAAGARYRPFSEGGSRLSNGQFLNRLVFQPLQQSDLGAPQRLTFRVTSVMGPPYSGASTVKGTWNIPFTMTPEAGTAIPLSLPAQTHDGITIQLEEMDVAPAGGGLDGQSGGVRVRYRISNLPAAASVGAVLSYPTSFVETNASSVSGPGSLACHNLLTLRLANGHVTVPGAIVPVAPVASGDVLRQPVGVGGTVEVEAIFFAPAPTGSVTFTINNVAIIEWRDGKSDYVRAAQGPWTFTLPLKP
ncbi:MAG TPA: DUF4179 domain-containing protein, partial [Ktedonobacterales bacterium]|nr:DUF4179 domain-containing protein [Ktedonobacterales bacterium]